MALDTSGPATWAKNHAEYGKTPGARLSCLRGTSSHERFHCFSGGIVSSISGRVAWRSIIGWSPPLSCRICVGRKPVSRTMCMVSRFQWQLPMQRVVSGTSASWIHAEIFPCVRTCSRSNSVPPGLSTRQISRSPRPGSQTEQKTSVTTTLSKCASKMCCQAVLSLYSYAADRIRIWRLA
jgi:hypothetical protein